MSENVAQLCAGTLYKETSDLVFRGGRWGQDAVPAVCLWAQLAGSSRGTPPMV